jgi:hypothetical protein
VPIDSSTPSVLTGMVVALPLPPPRPIAIELKSDDFAVVITVELLRGLFYVDLCVHAETSKSEVAQAHCC